jgi:ABC-type proline/glycine betaine transport system ATPase subunit
MGPSGSGKTTLLDLLAGRKTVGKMEGSILFAGNKATRPFLRRYTGYVEQFGECMPAPLQMPAMRGVRCVKRRMVPNCKCMCSV